jgi:hypothetical protein
MMMAENSQRPYVNLAQGFSIGWLRLETGSRCDRIVDAIHQSLRTITTAGPDELIPPAKGLVIVELLVGLYFAIIVLAIYASWARRPTS